MELTPPSSSCLWAPLSFSAWMLSCNCRPSRYGDLEEAFAAGARSVVFAPVPCPERVQPGKQGGACAVLALGIGADADVDAPCAPTRALPEALLPAV